VIARASAPGKLMLFGEYAALEGAAALALCLDRRIACTARPDARLRIDAPGVFAPVDRDPGELDGPCPDPSLALLWPILQAHAPRTGVALAFEAGFPPTWGLGSSSASTLAAAGALRSLAGAPIDPAALHGEVLAAQRALQGAASGYDVATQLLGGAVASWSTGEGGDVALAGGARAEKLSSRPELRWVVGWTGDKASTASMIRGVRERFPSGHPIYARIGDVSRRAVDAWRSGGALGGLLNDGHRLLDELGAVPEEVGAVIRALQADPDVHGARLCGAGGGDCVAILAADPDYAGRAAERHGLELLPLSPEPQGLIVECLP
jgi:mevalonate kinase